MKTDKDIINDSLMARIRELEAHQDKLTSTIEELHVKDYLLGQYVFTNRSDLLNTFADFVEDNYKVCAHHYGYTSIEQQVIDMLEDFADDADEASERNFNGVLDVITRLKVASASNND